jgi:sterol desaturase/sphingolipid hydroxylase (fatty acid hydroxylase superfamily)
MRAPLKRRADRRPEPRNSMNIMLGHSAFLNWSKEHVYWPLSAFVIGPLLTRINETVHSPVTWAVMLGILVLQSRMPASPRQRVVGLALIQDGLYFACSIATNLFITVTYVSALRGFYDAHLGLMTVGGVAGWPPSARIACAVLAADFGFWLHHYVRHRVPWFWEFHAVHHAQTDLNVFTDDRYHFVEYLIENTVNVFILSALGVQAVAIVNFKIARKWYTRFYHSNTKTNLGLLRYVLVTPQSHRVHHSHERRHRDKNFGVLFSVWDRLFGTQYAGSDEYPDTGISDADFPHPRSGWDVVTTLARQHVHPFKRIALQILGLGRARQRSSASS